MKIAVFLKTLDTTFNGVNYYGLNLIKTLSKDNFIYVFHSSIKVQNDIEEIKIRGITFNDNVKLINVRCFAHVIKYIKEFKCDLFINTSGDIFVTSTGVPSFEIVHFPPTKITDNELDKNNEVRRKYVKNYDLFLPNSNFTNYWLKDYLKVDGKVLYPAVNISPIEKNDLKNKENIIISVGRVWEDKRILEMINAFNSMDIVYKYIIAGAVSNDYSRYVNKVIEAIKGNKNIEFIPNPTKDDLILLYKKSKIFWHAKGYQALKPVDEEHFGIVTVEAMSQGCVPISFNGGGQPEIIDDSINGFLWSSPEELCRKTIALIGREENYQISAIEKSKIFLENEFKKNLNTIIYDYFNKGK